MKYLLTMLLTLSAICMTMTSCFEQDLSHCPPELENENIRVYFSFTAVAGSTDINPADINRLNLFVFDSNNKFVGMYVDENPKIDANYYIEIPYTDLYPGDFHFIAWGGLQDCYLLEPEQLVKGETTMDELLVHLKRDADDKVTSHPNMLFHGISKNETVVEGNNVFRLPMVQNTYTINLRTIGLPASDDTYRFTITDMNGSYKYDNDFAPCTELHYTTECGKENDNQLQATLVTLNLTETRKTAKLTVYNETTGNVLFTANLVELLLKLMEAKPNTNFDNTHVFDILLTFSGSDETNLTVNVNVNNWNVEDDDDSIIW